MYYTCENWRAEGHKATVHVDSCGHCKYGSGVAGGTRPDNGHWHGPFDSLVNAQRAVPGVAPRIHRCVPIPRHGAS